MRLMYDSTNPNDIPADAQMVAGYIDGELFRWPESAWARFPNAVKVRIARRSSTNDGHILDVESGIPTVWPLNKSIVDWVIRRRAAGVEPTIYCNQLNDWEPLKRLFTDAKVVHPQWWVARYDNKKNIPAGAVAKQYANPPLVGFHADASMVVDYWPGVDAHVDEENDMQADERNWLAQIYTAIWATAGAPERNGVHETVHDAVWANRNGIETIQELISDLQVGMQAAVREAVQTYLQENPPSVNVDVAAVAAAVVAEFKKEGN